MPNRYRALSLLLVMAACYAAVVANAAAAPAPAPAPATQSGPAPATVAGAAGSFPTARPAADLRQLMRGIFFPNSNVVFAAQQDLDHLPKVEDPSVSPNPLTSSYGGWEAVENASLALGESAGLLSLPGRKCSNGRAVPVQSAAWQKYVRGLRAAATVTYQAAKTKNPDAMVDASDTLTQACAACHDVYREKDTKGGDMNRCLP